MLIDWSNIRELLETNVEPHGRGEPALGVSLLDCQAWGKLRVNGGSVWMTLDDPTSIENGCGRDPQTGNAVKTFNLDHILVPSDGLQWWVFHHYLRGNGARPSGIPCKMIRRALVNSTFRVKSCIKRLVFQFITLVECIPQTPWPLLKYARVCAAPGSHLSVLDAPPGFDPQENKENTVTNDNNSFFSHPVIFPHIIKFEDNNFLKHFVLRFVRQNSRK